MKTLKFSICLMLLISCENFETSQDNIQPQSYLDEIEELKSLYEHGFDLALDALDNKKPENKHNDPYLSVEEQIMNMVNLTSKEIMVFKNGGEDGFLDEFQRIISGNNIQGRMRVDMLNVGNFYNLQQREILTPFIYDLELADNPELSKKIAETFQNQIINASSLSYEEKMALLTISSGTIVFSDFVLNGGIEKIKEKLITDYNGQVQTLGCSVNMRYVWLGAVIGAGTGAVGGAKVGCTGGMVGGPIGAAGGCVGGAVMGGATGFISGALMAAGAELLGSCFR
ncbi:MAG: hypothetical protein WD431_04290 [Cyclobacteriaceae bacterium]